MSDRYTTPEQGTDDWHVPLNENIRQLDIDVELRDTESNRSNYTPADGAKFLATDTGRRFLGNGTDWINAPMSMPTVDTDPSAPVDGQMWYNTSDGALRVSTGSGTVDIVSTNNDNNTDDSDDSSGSYYDGSTLYTSEYSGLQDAIDSASSRDRVLVDNDHTLDDTVSMKSDLLLRGDGGTIRSASSNSDDLIRTADLQNVWIDGLTLDGGWGGPGSGENVGVRLIGGVSLGSVSNLRITNCTLRYSGLNAIELVERGTGELKDIYIANNVISKSRNHGIILGVKEDSGSLHDVIIEDNEVYDSFDAQGIGFFGQSPGEAYNAAVLGNLVDNTGFSDKYGTNIAFEERADNCIAYGNEVVGNTDSNKGGIGSTKDGDYNIIGNNHVYDSARSLQVRSFDYFEPEGPPQHNVVMRNRVTGGNNGFYYELLDGDLHVSDNLFEDIGTDISDGGGNEGSNYTFYNNGSGVSSSEAGLPDSIGTSVSYTDSDNKTVANASWYRGSVDPDDPVTVSVSTNV